MEVKETVAFGLSNYAHECLLRVEKYHEEFLSDSEYKRFVELVFTEDHELIYMINTIINKRIGEKYQKRLSESES